MIIGETSSSITKADIFSQYSEADILSCVFPQITKIPCLICSPLRDDIKPSFSIYSSNSGHIYYKDHAKRESGSMMDLLCKYWSCTFRQALDKISKLLIENKGITVKTSSVKMLTRKEIDALTKIQVVVRPWKDYDLEYWESYGISKMWLKYAEILPISYKIVYKKEKQSDKWQKYVFPADKYAYCFIERKEGKLSIKIYQPYNTNGFKWCSKMDSSVISLWTKVPEYGNRLVICSSVKDALCLSANLHIPAIAPQGEGYSISDTAISELKRRYKKVFICYDTDLAGIIDSQKLSERTGFKNVVPDLGKSKDLSDYWKSLENKDEFKEIEKLFY